MRWLPFVIGAEEFESVDALLLCMLDLVLGLLLRLSLILLERSLFVFLDVDFPFHSEASGHKIVKWKQEPLLAPCDSAHMLPPMASTNLLQIAKPRPDPPWFRCFDWSTYVWIILINLCMNCSNLTDKLQTEATILGNLFAYCHYFLAFTISRYLLSGGVRAFQFKIILLGNLWLQGSFRIPSTKLLEL